MQLKNNFRQWLMLCILVIGGVSDIFGQKNNSRINLSDGQVIPDFSWLNQKEGPRPKYVWENREDVIYHERYYQDSAKMTAPEIYPIMRGIWVFNRSINWIKEKDGTIIVFSDKEDCPLTGENQVSAWYSDPHNRISHQGNFTIFEKLNSTRRRDAAVLPSFQFHKSQHPIVKINVAEASDDWQFVVSIKGRSGPPLISSGWQTGPKTLFFDISKALEKKGYGWNYPELHFVIGTWGKSTESNTRIKFEATLLPQPAVVGCLPVIRTINNSKAGIPITAIVTGTDKDTLKVFARVDGHTIEMIRDGNTWKTILNNLAAGSYTVKLSTNIPGVTGSTVFVRVTDGQFLKHNKTFNSIEKNGHSQSPLTGSFQGTFFFKDVGLASEQLINSQQEWDTWDKLEHPGEHQHFWESLNRSELDNRFSYLSENGWDVVHLHSHYGIWERFDASGNLAPHGVEQLAVYIDEASKNGLDVQVTLSSYPYGYSDNKDWREGTSPYIQTREKGFKNEDWYNPENEPFRSLYHQYIKDFVGMFKDETSLLSFSSSGEGDADHINGIRRFLDTKEVIRSIDTNHVIVSEPIHTFPSIDLLPQTIVKGYSSDLVGVRNYNQGNMFKPEVEMSVYLRLTLPVPNAYIAEGSFPISNLYARFSNAGDSWLGTDYYRYNVRDWLYLGLVNRMPLIVTWDEAFTEDEHRVLAEVKNLINWNQLPEQPKVSIIVEESKFPSIKFKLGMFEEIFSRLAVNYRFIENRALAEKDDWVIDASQPFDSLRYSASSALPSRIQQTIPFKLSADYATSYMITKDRRTMVAYIINKTHYKKHRFYLTGINNRMPVEGYFELTFKNLPENLKYRLYDLDTKKIAAEGRTSKKTGLRIKDTKADYVIVVYP